MGKTVSIETDAARGLIDYGSTGIMLLASLWAILKMALNFKHTTDKHQERIDKMNADFFERLEEKEAKHIAFIQSLANEFRDEREKLRAAIEHNAEANNKLREIIEKRLIELRQSDDKNICQKL